ncbi:MAG: response regulator transcription factor [Coriobacteriia bacterium]|nr:response regulator transcription factor [Coriobacteriia bacterium]
MRTVLVVDDNAKIVEVLTAYLQGEGFRVLTAADGESALAEAAATPPDIALLDVMMPGVDGIEVMKRLQRDYATPVILVTARSDEVDRLVGLEVGADDYIVKPFSPREVVARVKAVLRRGERGSRDEPDAVISAGGITIDPSRRTVRIGDDEVGLTRTEFDMLAAMASHPGRVYTRLQLLELASGEAYDGYERTVDAHIKNLRRKLGDDPRVPRFVGTVFGVGYRFEEGR